MQLTIAHLSDIHLAPLCGLGLKDVNVKRALGLANWLIKRRKIHLRAAVDALVADLGQRQVDHVIVSGDLANLGLPGEHETALAWLTTLGTPSQISVVPGNHDIYCQLRHDRGVERWRPHMESDAAGSRYVEPAEGGFPYVRLLGRLAIVGVNSAIPTRPFSAIGRVGVPQMRALAATLERLGGDRFARVVVIHHPPLPGQADERRGLIDAVEVEQVLLSHGAELVLHGHNHRALFNTLKTKSGLADIIGVPSASMVDHTRQESGHESGHESAQWHRYDISRAKGQWQTGFSSRVWNGAEQRFVDGPTRTLGE